MFRKVCFQRKENTKKNNSFYSDFFLFVLRFLFTADKRLTFYEQFSALLKNDISRHDALSLMRASYQKHRTILKSFWLEIKILNDLIYRIDCGLGSESLADIFEGLVPQSDITILSVGSKKGQSLDQVVAIISQFKKLKSEVFKMFVSPIIAGLLVIIGIYAANSYIFPILTNIKPVDQFPYMTKNLYDFCKYFADNLMNFCIFVTVLILMVYFSLSMFTGKLRNILDKLPPYNIYKQIQATNFLISLSMLLEYEIDFDSAIQQVNRTASKYLRSFLSDISYNISCGLRPGEAIAKVKLFAKSTQIYIEILDESNILGFGMARLSVRSIELQLKSIKKIMIIISSLLIALSMFMALMFLFSIASFSFSF